MKIIDCFIFYNELELLTYRLNILCEVVDYFVIVESTHTFAGKIKELYFDNNKMLFEKFKEKIIHIVEDLPYKHPCINYDNNEQWINERVQRNAISRGFDNINLIDDDVIILTDVDEIPDLNTLSNIKNGNIAVDINILGMDMYYYNLNTKHNATWHYAKIMKYNTYKNLNIELNDIRVRDFPIINDGGWHLSYFGNSNFIKNKINAFSHQELNNENFTDVIKIEERIKNGNDLYDRQEIVLDTIPICNNDYLPPEYNEYLSNFLNKY